MRSLVIGEMVVVNDSVPNALYHGRVAIYICPVDEGNDHARAINWLVRFPMPFGMLSLVETFRRGELTTLDEIEDA